MSSEAVQHRRQTQRSQQRSSIGIPECRQRSSNSMLGDQPAAGKDDPICSGNVPV